MIQHFIQKTMSMVATLNEAEIGKMFDSANSNIKQNVLSLLTEDI